MKLIPKQSPSLNRIHVIKKICHVTTWRKTRKVLFQSGKTKNYKYNSEALSGRRERHY